MAPKAKGKFIVFEGIDGSGKSTQTKLLAEHLEQAGYRTEKIDFPQYGTKSAGLIEEYLNGKYGKAEEVGPYRGSIFYACDRYDASFKIKKWLKEGKIVISDRYVSSNVGHQGGKIKDPHERRKFLAWLYQLEYGIFAIPKPDITFLLKTSPEYSLQLAHKISDKEKLRKRRAYLGKKKRDIHEKDYQHLAATLKVYVQEAKKFPREYKIIECIKGGKLLSPPIVHQEVWKIIQKTL